MLHSVLGTEIEVEGITRHRNYQKKIEFGCSLANASIESCHKGITLAELKWPINHINTPQIQSLQDTNRCTQIKLRFMIELAPQIDCFAQFETNAKLCYSQDQ